MPAIEFSVADNIATLLLNRPEAKTDYAKESFRRFAAREPARFVWPAPPSAGP